jgi:hypothetical protein
VSTAPIGAEMVRWQIVALWKASISSSNSGPQSHFSNVEAHLEQFVSLTANTSLLRIFAQNRPITPHWLRGGPTP